LILQCRWIVVCLAALGVGSPFTRAAEVLYSENFDGPAVKPGQSACAAPLGWDLVSPNAPAKNSIGNVFLGAGKFGWSGNYLDGATATVPAAENVVQKDFPAVGSGHVVLSCRAFAAGETSAGSQITCLAGRARIALVANRVRALRGACVSNSDEMKSLVIS
jgi:hypothetical protein